MVSPAMASMRRGTGPLAAASTMPCARTKSSAAATDAATFAGSPATETCRVGIAGVAISARRAVALGDDGRAVAKDLRDPVHHLGRVVTDADHGVGADLLRVPEHQLER